ncbi:hypothetical protein [Photobacterium carnosum]|uniref:hypothetical protein n=1 Tax=Photobacterium carnosum TaxID=2023717 RepID=UPI00242D651A|nr:hypothetical protein [Photobacterium carnosum]
MNRWACLFLAVTTMNVHSEGLKIPNNFTLKPKSGDIMNSILNGECQPINNGKIKCYFNQVAFSKTDETHEELETKLARIDAPKMKGIKEFNKSFFCNQDTKQKIADMITQSNNPRKSEQLLKLEKLISNCPIKNETEAKAIMHRMIKFDYETDKLTCKISFNTFELEFSKAGSGNNQYWRNISEPNINPCGLTNIVSMKYDKDGNIWEYSGHRVISIPKNKTFLGHDSCTTMNSKPMVWSLYGDDIYNNCQIINPGF